MTEVIKHSYQTNPQNTNCEQGHLVSDIKECMNASRELKREYIGRTTSMNRPVGCYWSSYDRAYFNTITDPLSTRPKHFGNRGGICTKPRMSNVTVVLIFVPCIFVLLHRIIRYTFSLFSKSTAPWKVLRAPQRF